MSEPGGIMRHACDEKRSPDLVVRHPAGCVRIRRGTFALKLKLRLSLNFMELYIRPNWSVKYKTQVRLGKRVAVD
jgi:hypothetical protein